LQQERLSIAQNKQFSQVNKKWEYICRHPVAAFVGFPCLRVILVQRQRVAKTQAARRIHGQPTNVWVLALINNHIVRESIKRAATAQAPRNAPSISHCGAIARSIARVRAAPRPARQQHSDYHPARAIQRPSRRVQCFASGQGWIFGPLEHANRGPALIAQVECLTAPMWGDTSRGPQRDCAKLQGDCWNGE